jgi:iron(III) transport system substrate-binding protein
MHWAITSGNFFLLLPFYFCLVLPFALSPAIAAEVAAPGQGDWKRVVQVAREEREVVIYGGDLFELVFREFPKRYPEIKVSMWGLGGGASGNAQRLLTERRAGRSSVDVWISGVDTLSNILLRARMLEPVKPALMLPEVTDESKWWRGRHHYADPQSQYIFVYEGSVQTGGISYNTKLVNPREMKSYWDLIHPRWRGKIVSTDPRRPGTSQQNLRFFYYNPDLGPEFLRRLFGEMDVVMSRDDQQMIDWLAVGKYAFGLFIRGAVQDAKKQGLPLDDFYAGQFKEGALVDSTRGGLSLLSRAPHPNAARLVINWFLSRDGQKAYQKYFFESGSSYGGNSMREDISKDDVRLESQRREGVKLMFTGRPEWIDMKPIHDLVNKTLTEATKK